MGNVSVFCLKEHFFYNNFPFESGLYKALQFNSTISIQNLAFSLHSLPVPAIY